MTTAVDGLILLRRSEQLAELVDDGRETGWETVGVGYALERTHTHTGLESDSGGVLSPWKLTAYSSK
jgi:hypothetical protein